MHTLTSGFTRARRYLLSGLLISVGILMLAACSATPAPTTSTSAPPTSATTAGAATTAPAAQSSPAPSGSPAIAAASPATAQSSPAAASPSAIRKVNPNTASIPEIQQALESAGVANAARWAREVDEYKPYPADDPSMAKLRQNLAKYNPAPDVVEKIISALNPA